MDAFARALLIANEILENSRYKSLRETRYGSFADGDGKTFEEGNMPLETLADVAGRNGEPSLISGKQEMYENLINQYL